MRREFYFESINRKQYFILQSFIMMRQRSVRIIAGGEDSDLPTRGDTSRCLDPTSWPDKHLLRIQAVIVCFYFLYFIYFFIFLLLPLLDDPRCGPRLGSCPVALSSSVRWSTGPKDSGGAVRWGMPHNDQWSIINKGSSSVRSIREERKKTHIYILGLTVWAVIKNW